MYISILLYLKSWMKIITVCAATVYSDIMFERLDRPRQDMKHFESSQLAEVLCPWLPGPCLSPSAKGVHRCLRGFIGSHQLAHPLGESEATVAWLQALGRWKRRENLEKRDCLCHKFGENHANWTIRSSEFSDGRSSPRWSFSDLTPLPHCRPNWFQPQFWWADRWQYLPCSSAAQCADCYVRGQWSSDLCKAHTIHV